MWLLDGPVELLDSDETLIVVSQGRRVPDDVTYVDGLPQAAHAATKVTITATWQPMGGKDLLLLPEGFRERENIWLWQEHYDQSPEQFKVNVSDIVLRLGKAYHVQSEEDWGSYTRSQLCGVDIGPYQGLIDPENPPPVYPATTSVVIIEAPPAPVVVPALPPAENLPTP